MHKLIDYICDELEELERKAEKDGKLSMAEVQYMDTLAHAKKNLLKSEEMMDEGGSSYYEGEPSERRRGSSRRGSNRRGSSYRRSMEGGESGQSRRRRGSSYEDGMTEMVESIYEIMDELPENTKREAQKFVQKLEQTM